MTARAAVAAPRTQRRRQAWPLGEDEDGGGQGRGHEAQKEQIVGVEKKDHAGQHGQKGPQALPPVAQEGVQGPQDDKGSRRVVAGLPADEQEGHRQGEQGRGQKRPGPVAEMAAHQTVGPKDGKQRGQGEGGAAGGRGKPARGEPGRLQIDLDPGRPAPR